LIIKEDKRNIYYQFWWQCRHSKWLVKNIKYIDAYQ